MERRHGLGCVAQPLGHDLDGSVAFEVEEGLEGVALDEGHDEERRQLGWRSSVLEEHSRHRHPGAPKAPQQPSLAEHVAVERGLDAGRSDLDHHRFTISQHAGEGEARAPAREAAHVADPL